MHVFLSPHIYTHIYTNIYIYIYVYVYVLETCSLVLQAFRSKLVQHAERLLYHSGLFCLVAVSAWSALEPTRVPRAPAPDAVSFAHFSTASTGQDPVRVKAQ